MDTKSDLICFACRSGLNPSRSNLTTHQKLPEGQRTFLLLELLGFPKNAETMIKETRLCGPCFVLVKKGLELKNEIQKLEERLEKEVRSVILDKFRNGVKEGQKPSVSLSKSEVEPPQKKFKPSENERNRTNKNEPNPTLSSVEGLIDSADIKEEVDSSMELDTEQISERFHSVSGPSEENDYQCDLADEDHHTEINFEEPEKKGEKKKSKRSKKRKHFISLEPPDSFDPSGSDPDDDSDPDWEVTWKANLEKQSQKKYLQIFNTKKSQFLTSKRGDSSAPSVSDPPKKDSDGNWGGMSETVEDNEFMEITAVQPSLEKVNVPTKVKVRKQNLKRQRPQTTYFKYDCPSVFCPNVKNFTYNDFAQHLRFHKRRPYRCKLCCEFILEDQTLWKDHLEKTHPEVEPASAEENIIADHAEPGNVFHSAVYAHGRFPTEKERDEHEKGCRRCKRNLSDTKGNQITCVICQKVFRNSNEWRFHRVLEHPEEDWMRCPFCDESFKEKTVEGVEERNDVKLYEHINTIHRSENDVGKQLKFYDNCEDCGLLFKVSSETAEHFQDKHGFQGEVKDWTYSCRMCDKKYGSTVRLRRHISTFHFRPEGSICDLCGAKFAVHRNLIEHKFSQHQINEDNLPRIACPKQGCEFNCFFKETLQSHCEQHNPRDKICEICGKGFKRGPDLNRHRATHSTSVNN